ncbi:hypothetical protein PORCRE_27 [Porphyromonas crevioricanis JCM 15906]|uniref:Uncharacterized protein n=3 Tax=Porphyromonas crevioricanis TaxID=393921 RepID=A0A2X4STG8_9PORP|nr:hypothetical protein [Porphyromonas crevioricanis]GAD07767.1 hypothetical protein PORCAN_1394 [Porphyromonas crevioricanis JCM 13913]KGN93534.1 hypothetical protein HQ38_08855 [Porphyromonas crevioricanis]SJZ87845.1 hypothetical protein SAMN02745203_01147 [Porphyromonas crevioricanis]SQH73141.1 Uncharacterised protein [Porphyromonas crevioricanis]GAD04344.1 hypothetical protein PORCRE_27 [Porphyromonas crevioricanis JCM 15906]
MKNYIRLTDKSFLWILLLGALFLFPTQAECQQKTKRRKKTEQRTQTQTVVPSHSLMLYESQVLQLLDQIVEKQLPSNLKKDSIRAEISQSIRVLFNEMIYRRSNDLPYEEKEQEIPYGSFLKPVARQWVEDITYTSDKDIEPSEDSRQMIAVIGLAYRQARCNFILIKSNGKQTDSFLNQRANRLRTLLLAEGILSRHIGFVWEAPNQQGIRLVMIH